MTEEQAAVLECRAIVRRFREGDSTLEVLSGADLVVRPAERLAIIGSSGSGKTTLLQIMGGLDEPTSGGGPEMIGAFHQLMKRLPADLTVVIIEHDMGLAFDVADTMTVLNYGAVVFEGSPDEARSSSLLREIYLGTFEDA